MTIESDRSRLVQYSIMFAFLVCVTANYIFAKLLDLQEVIAEDGTVSHFKHPVF